MKSLAFFVGCFVCCFATDRFRDTKGYYWRDYRGEIPEDAVPGGKDKYERTTYIGQGLHIKPVNGKLIPGKIDASQRTLTYAWHDDVPHVLTENIKILCSQYPEKFQWITTDISKAKRMPPDNFVLGGYDTSYPLYIGRIHAEGELVVGKVTLQEPYDYIGYSVGGTSYYGKTTFEILAYNP